MIETTRHLAFPLGDNYIDLDVPLFFTLSPCLGVVYGGTSPKKMINAAEAREIVFQSVSLSPVIEDIVLSNCVGRVLAADIVSPHDVPLFDNSSMDGYAVRTTDLRSATREHPVPLKVLEEIAAGKSPAHELSPGSSMRIMTGAPIPGGADAVAEQEVTEAGNGMVRVFVAADPGRNIRRRGEDVKEGSTVLERGTRLTPAGAGVLASLGIRRVSVHKRPRVALITTGNEIVDVDQVPAPGQIRNSNAHTLAGLIRESGAEPVDLGIVPDLPDDLSTRIRSAFAFDAVVTSGGVSVGKYDMVLDVLKSEGVDIRFWKVNIKPGMPMAFGMWQQEDRNPVPVFALPGNPVSSMVTFRQFVRPGLEKLGGVHSPHVQLRVKAVLGQGIPKRDGKRYFVRGMARNDDDRIIVMTTGSQSSGILTSMAKANCLIVVPENARDLKEGDVVEIELL